MLVHTAIAPHVGTLCMRAAPTCEHITHLYGEIIAEDTEAAGSGAAARTAGCILAAEALAAAAAPAQETAGLLAQLGPDGTKQSLYSTEGYLEATAKQWQ